MNDDALLTIEQTAEVLTLSSNTIRRRIASGEIRAVRFGDAPNSPVRVPSSEVARFLRRGAERQRERALA